MLLLWRLLLWWRVLLRDLLLGHLLRHLSLPLRGLLPLLVLDQDGLKRLPGEVLLVTVVVSDVKVQLVDLLAVDEQPTTSVTVPSKTPCLPKRFATLAPRYSFLAGLTLGMGCERHEIGDCGIETGCQLQAVSRVQWRCA